MAEYETKPEAPANLVELSEQEIAFRDEATQVAIKQLTASENFKQPRMAEIRDNEDMVAGKVKPALQGRYNIPFDGVLASSFIDTMVGQVNKPPTLEFGDPKGSNLKSSKMLTSAWQRESSPTRGKWRKKDRNSKRLAAVSNIGIFKLYGEGDPDFKVCLDVIDHYDFHSEPNGGNELEAHLFKGQGNIFKVESDLDNKYYDQAQVKKLKEKTSSSEFKINDDQYKNKVQRFQTLGLNLETNNYTGSSLYNLTEWVMRYKGKQYYLVFDRRCGVWVRFKEIKQVFESGLSPWAYWNSKEDPFNPWSRGHFDDVKPIFEAIRINLNEVLNNNRKRNWDMKAVDGRMFPDLSQLDWKQDGIAVANVPLNQSIQNGIYHFVTPEISGALNLNAYLNNFAGINSGISDQTKGQSTQDTLGIARINDMNLSKKMKLISDSYEECYTDLGTRFDWALYEHFPEKYMVKLVGIEGAEWSEVKKEDLEPDFDCSVISYQDEQQDIDAKNEKKGAVLERLGTNPNQKISSLINPQWYVEQELKVGGWSDEDVKRALAQSAPNDILISQAKKVIENALEGKELKPNKRATTAFLQVIEDYLSDNSDISDEVYVKLEEYFHEHTPIAIENAFKAQEARAALNPEPEQDPNATGDAGGEALAPADTSAPPLAPAGPEAPIAPAVL